MALTPWLTTLFMERGFSASQAARLMALKPLALLIGGPLWSWLADRTQKRAAILRGATFAIATTSLLLWWAPTPWIVVLAFGLFALSKAPQAPLADALTLNALGNDRRRYGQIRLWGSVAFIIVMTIAGWARDEWADAPLAITSALMIAAAILAWRLPSPPAVDRPKHGFQVLFRSHGLQLATLIAFLHGCATSTGDAFLARRFAEAGLPASSTGIAFGLGVAVEVAIMAFAPRLFRRIRPETLLLISVAMGVPRWWLTSTLTDPTLLVLTQLAHGFTFGGFWVGGVAVFGERAPKGLENSAQSLLPAAMFGAGSFVAMMTASAWLTFGSVAGLFRLMTGVESTAVVAAAALWKTSSRSG